MPTQRKASSFSIRPGKGGGEKRKVSRVPAMQFRPVQIPLLQRLVGEGIPETGRQ